MLLKSLKQATIIKYTSAVTQAELPGKACFGGN